MSISKIKSLSFPVLAQTGAVVGKLQALQLQLKSPIDQSGLLAELGKLQAEQLQLTPPVDNGLLAVMSKLADVEAELLKAGMRVAYAEAQKHTNPLDDVVLVPSPKGVFVLKNGDFDIVWYELMKV